MIHMLSESLYKRYIAFDLTLNAGYAGLCILLAVA
jgi:hypothetical protein